MSIRSLLPKLPLALVSVGLILTMATSPAFAGHVQCGDVITQDTTLDSDLLDCPGDGVVIGASGITLDLAGHTIDGIGFNQGVENLFHDGVTVTNGTIRDFFDAVLFEGGDDGVLSRLNVDHVGHLGSVPGSAVRLQSSGRNRVAGNTLAGSVSLSGDSDDNHVVGNLVRHGDVGIRLRVTISGPPTTLHIPDRNRLERNTVNDTSSAMVITGLNTTIERNTVNDTAVGILVDNLDTTIVDNRVVESVGTAISVSGHGTFRIEGNHVSRSGFGGPLVEPSPAISVSAVRPTTLVRNRVVHNGADGILVRRNVRFPTAHVIEDNFTSHNGDDGIDFDAPGWTLPELGVATVTRNKAIHNGDFGIAAVPGVTDGGGNKARANGNPLQCLNVRCK